jgi:uncharacterized protein (DUF2141 family)
MAGVPSGRNGIPTEALGYSNHPYGFTGPPEFEKCRFPLQTEEYSINISVFYFD